MISPDGSKAANAGWGRPSVANGKIVFSLGERTGNIWMTDLPR